MTRLSATEFHQRLCGIPFVDASFSPVQLLTAVACVRRRYAPNAHNSLEEYLQPDNAREIYAQHAVCSLDEFPYRELDAAQAEAVNEAIAYVEHIRPEWKALFETPIEIVHLLDERVSATSVLFPQKVFLGEVAFTNCATLRETIVHEHAHIWLNFIAEVFDLQTRQATSEHVLPSGTRDKTVRGVLLAAHFAAAAIGFYDACIRFDESALRKRRNDLVAYLGGCLSDIRDSEDMSDMGRIVWARLNSVYEPAKRTTAVEQETNDSLEIVTHD